jgi:aspartyl/glutamyl-tRNA(Asn/Gln) amidotransferase C subunit
MARLDDRDLDTLAQLARLDVADADRAALRGDLERVLTYVDRLAEFDDPGVEPLRHPSFGAAAAVAATDLRADVPRRGLPTSVLEALAPAWRDGRVEVARTVDQDA